LAHCYCLLCYNNTAEQVLVFAYIKMEKLGLTAIINCQTPSLSLAFLVVLDVFIIRTWMQQTPIGSLAMNLVYVAFFVLAMYTRLVPIARRLYNLDKRPTRVEAR
jgi:hypothetical protein